MKILSRRQQRHGGEKGKLSRRHRGTEKRKENREDIREEKRINE